MVFESRIFVGVVADRMDGVFRLTNDGVRALCGVLAIDDGLGVNRLSRTFTRDDASRLAAGDIEAKRSSVDRMCGEAIFRRAVSIAFAFWLRIRSPAFSANCNPMVSRREVSAMRNDGPVDVRNGVSLPSRRNGVPSSSPHVMSGLSVRPGCGDGVFTKLNPRIMGVAELLLCTFPSMPMPSVCLPCEKVFNRFIGNSKNRNMKVGNGDEFYLRCVLIRLFIERHMIQTSITVFDFLFLFRHFQFLFARQVHPVRHEHDEIFILIFPRLQLQIRIRN